MLAAGLRCGLHKIERLMRAQALRARPRRRGLPKDHGERHPRSMPSNILDRQFAATVRGHPAKPEMVADFTYVWTAEGWLYVAVVIDLFSRRVVGWSMSSSMTAQLVADALVMAIWRRGKPQAVLHHSDRGSQGGFNRSSSIAVTNACRYTPERMGVLPPPWRSIRPRGPCAFSFRTQSRMICTVTPVIAAASVHVARS